ncbi:MAG: AAA family ATPase [Eubacteriales bacterium]|nr:AAA family ATPase [Eubacteriales bacterium]
MTDRKYISTKEAASIMRLSTRRVVGLCNDGKLEGAIRAGRSWKIPEETVYTYMGEAKPEEEKETILSCAVGNTSYMDVVKNSYYVDKTLLIRDLIDDQVPVILFTRPRRFGKTLALDMLKIFFEKTGEDTSVYFRDKKIWACGEKYQKMQGAFPVISITFKDAKFSDWESTYTAIKNVIRDEFMRHEELFSSDSLNPVERDYLSRMQSDELGEVEYTRALLNLSRMLEKEHKTKVVILIDEYDTPIQQGHSRGFYNEVITFMRNFMSGGLKDNASLAFGALTGILRVSKENLFSGLNNPIVNSVLDEKYSKYFGFTIDEVNDMATYYGQEEKIDELREWYDGYRFGSTEIYNPWSVANYFYNNCQAKPYWTNTSDNEIIREIMASITPEIADNLLALMQGEMFQTSLNMDVIYPRITDGTDTIFSFLLIAGYLRPVNDAVETEFGTFIELELPNKEIRRMYNTEILSWLRGTLDGNVMAGLEKALYLNDGKKLQESIRKYMITCISCFDGATESFYHGMMLGLVAGMSSRYYIRSNRESGDGRFDLTLEPKISSMPGIVMEFKAIKDPAGLPASAREALMQIGEKHYDTDMKDRGIKEIVKYGVAFAGKNVEIIKE